MSRIMASENEAAFFVAIQSRNRNATFSSRCLVASFVSVLRIQTQVFAAKSEYKIMGAFDYAFFSS